MPVPGMCGAALAEVLETVRALPERRCLVEHLLREAARAAAGAAAARPEPAPALPVDLCSLKERLMRRAGKAAGLSGSLAPGVLRRVLLAAGQRELSKRVNKVQKGRAAQARPEGDDLIEEVEAALQLARGPGGPVLAPPVPSSGTSSEEL